MNLEKQIGHRLRLLRHIKNYTQEEVAARLGVTRVSVSHWEAGTCRMTSDAIVKLAKFYEVSSDYILGLEEDRK